MNPHVSGALCAGAILAVPALDRAWRRWGRRVPGLALDALLFGSLAAFTAWVYWPLVAGHPATTWDNSYGPLKVLELEDLFRRHELFGWSDFEGGGFPAHANYPMLGAAFGAFLHALPGVSLDRMQAWCVLFAMWTMCLACAFVARLHFDRRVALLAGLLGLLDPGAWWVGGHFMTVEVGMWIQTVSSALTVAGLGLWAWAVTRREPWPRVLAGAVFGVAILFHPQAILLGGAAAVVMLPVLLATRGARPGEVLRHSVEIGAVSFVVSAFWLVPYVALRGESWFPQVDPPAAEWMWDQFSSGQLLRGPGLWMGASFVGAVMLLGDRRPFGRFLAIAAPALAVVFTVEAMNLLHLRDPLHGDKVAELQLARMYYLQRPLALVLAAYAMGAPLGRALRRLDGGVRGWRGWLVRGGVAGLVWTLLQLPGVQVPGLPPNDPPQGIQPAQAAEVEQAFDAATAQMQPGDHVALREADWNNHDLVLPASRRGLKILKIGSDAAMMFKGHFSTDDPEVLARAGGAVVIAANPLTPPLQRLAEVAHFGDYSVRTLPRRPRAWMVGPGAVSVESWQPEEIHLRVTGAQPLSRVRLGLSYFEAWRAEDGERLVPFAMRDATFTELRAHDGEIVLRYRAPRAQWLGALVSFLGLVGMIGILARSRRRPAPPQVATAPPTDVAPAA